MFTVHYRDEDDKACCGERGNLVLSPDRDMVDCEDCIALMPREEPCEAGECFRGAEASAYLAESQARIQRELK